MTYQERYDTLNKNPVLVVRHFQYRVEIIVKIIVLDSLMGKTNCYGIRIKFQVRGSPHVQSFIWVLNAPKLTSSTKQIMQNGLTVLYVQIFLMLTRNQNHMNQSSPLKFIVTQKLGSTAMRSAGFILANFWQTIQL